MRAAPSSLAGSSTGFEMVGSGPVSGTISGFISSVHVSSWDGVSLSATGTIGQPLVYTGTGMLKAQL
jgi:hypothetical protein